MSSSTSATQTSHGFGISAASVHTNTTFATTMIGKHDTSFLDTEKLQSGNLPNKSINFEYDEFKDKNGENETFPSKPSTPSGKVVETGHEHTGRWTREEHESFLSALQQYGKEWKKVAAKVKTRTVVQTRTHAQKYFQKLQKVTNGEKDDINQIDLGTIVFEKTTLSSTKKRAQCNQLNNSTGIWQQQQAAQLAATQAAAQLMTQMSQVKVPDLLKSHQKPHSIAYTSSNKYLGQENNEQVNPRQSNVDVSNDHYSSTSTYEHPLVQSVMKIVPPAPEQSMNKGMFPEPSPAACGKRKLIEIAAAQMLAGVALSGEGSHALKEMKVKVIPRKSVEKRSDFGNVRISNNFCKKESRSEKSSMGIGLGNLQIVNPESLGVSYGNDIRRKNLVQGSPSTPWDGQLEALVSEVKSKAIQQNAESPDNGIDTKSDSGRKFHPLSSSSYCTRTEFHKAVSNGSLQNVKSAIDAVGSAESGECQDNSGQFVSLRDSLGFSPLHSAVSLTSVLEQANVAITMTHLLLSAGADISCYDQFGNTPLHWAVREGNSDVAQILVMKSCPLDVQNAMGETALHWAMRAGKKGMKSVCVLLENGSRSNVYCRNFKRALDIAVKGFLDVDEEMMAETQHFVRAGKVNYKKATLNDGSDQIIRSVEAAEERRQTRANFFFHSSQMRTLVLHHSECLEHIPKSESDWEVPGRVNSIMSRILGPIENAKESGISTSIRDYEIQVSTEFDKASLELLSRVHSAEYLTFVNDLSKELEKRRKQKIIEGSKSADNIGQNKIESSVVPFTPMVQRTIMNKSNVKKGAHSDTSFSAGSLRAARRAAGAVQHAVDCVLVGRNRNAFCIVRPPGHHAGVNGLLDGGESCGFCIFNNVAAGAMHALSDESHRPKCEKVAIIDVDAHHGNGTEEIVRKCHDPGRLFFFSVHLYDNPDKLKPKSSNAYKFYPGTGDRDDVAHNIINVPITPMWREKEIQSSLLPKPASTQAPVVNESRHNTRNKAKQKAASNDLLKKPTTEKKTISVSSAKGKNSGAGASACAETKCPASTDSQTQMSCKLMGGGRQSYRCAITQRLIPALRAFDPDLILISLGFDAAHGDVGNARHYAGGKEAAGIDLTPEDYSWTTRKIMEVADICCAGRVISILEGGYGKSNNYNGEQCDKVKEPGSLDQTIISECALLHLQSLIDPYESTIR